MDAFTENKFCKYCDEKLRINFEEGLECIECKSNVHLKCLKRGSVPGGLQGDIFFTFTCQECSPDETEAFSRIKLTWLQAVVLVLYHLQNKSPGLSRKGFFHWRHHIGKFIDKNWDLLFLSEIKKKEKWTGTIAGTLSHFSNYIFLSGNAVFNEPAVWALMYPKLTPFATSSVYSVMMIEKQHLKNNKQTLTPDVEFFHVILRKYITHEECLKVFTDTQIFSNCKEECESSMDIDTVQKHVKQKRKIIVPKIEFSSKMMKKLYNCQTELSDELPTTSSSSEDSLDEAQCESSSSSRSNDTNVTELKTLLDPMCHYNASLSDISDSDAQHAKLTGGINLEITVSPYSGIHLKPYIRTDLETFPPWLKLMAELQLLANWKNKSYVLPPRGPLDFAYVQPGHIPAINSLCSQFFWPGIDLTQTLQYPEYSCVVLYRRLIVGFAFLVPDVSYRENYLSFIFLRPHWRNCGIGRFMIYHLIQTSPGKDIILHVPMDNPAVFLYHKFGFKKEKLIQGFYDKYLTNSEASRSKYTFFYRLKWWM